MYNIIKGIILIKDKYLIKIPNNNSVKNNINFMPYLSPDDFGYV
jgi:hypothetical protein